MTCRSVILTPRSRICFPDPGSQFKDLKIIFKVQINKDLKDLELFSQGEILAVGLCLILSLLVVASILGNSLVCLAVTTDPNLR